MQYGAKGCLTTPAALPGAYVINEKMRLVTQVYGRLTNMQKMSWELAQNYLSDCVQLPHF